MQHLFYTIILASLYACNANTKAQQAQAAVVCTPIKDTLNYADYSIPLKPNGADYNAAKSTILAKRLKLQAAYNAKQITLDSVSRYFVQAYINTIIPHWYGTQWSFEGHTTTPQQGEIACGYLVSTTLSHSGVNINRYKVAQQAPYNEALTYACGDSVLGISGAQNISPTLLQAQYPEGLYFIGLYKSHVGLLLKRADRIFFIHSDYVDGKTVIEDAATSSVLAYYRTFYVAPLSHNTNFIKKWLANEAVAISN